MPPADAEVKMEDASVEVTAEDAPAAENGDEAGSGGVSQKVSQKQEIASAVCSQVGAWRAGTVVWIKQSKFPWW